VRGIFTVHSKSRIFGVKRKGARRIKKKKKKKKKQEDLQHGKPQILGKIYISSSLLKNPIPKKGQTERSGKRKLFKNGHEEPASGAPLKKLSSLVFRKDKFGEKLNLGITSWEACK